MRVKDIVIEDFLNYKEPSLFIVSAVCDWKCCQESGMDAGECQNHSLASTQTNVVKDEMIYSAYMSNDITKAVVIGGLEPMLQFDEVINLIDYFRSNNTDCPFVIYTGYTEDELEIKLKVLSTYSNIIIKFGRYIPNRNSVFDPLLGVELASDNQYAKQISRSR